VNKFIGIHNLKPLCLKAVHSFFCIILFVPSIHSQSSREILLNNNWTTIFGNTIKVSQDSLRIDHHKYSNKDFRDSRSNTISISDSIFLFQNKDKDTLLLFKYVVNSDSLIINYLPVKSRWNGSYYSCGYYFEPLCHLMGKNATYYNKDYLLSASAKFSFDSIKIKNGFFELALEKSTTLFFNQKRITSSFDPMMYNGNVVTVGKYQGNLNPEIVNSINNLIIRKKLLKNYLFTDQKPILSIDDHIGCGVVIKWNSIRFPIDNCQIESIIRQGFKKEIMDENNFDFYGTTVNTDTLLVRYIANVYNAMRGYIEIMDSIKTKDTTVFIYKMKIDSIYQNVNQNIPSQDVTCFVSEKKLNIVGNNVLISYKTRMADYQDLNNKRYSVKYNLIDRTFKPKTHLIFEYDLRNGRIEIERMTIRSRQDDRFDPNRFFIETNAKTTSNFPSELDYKLVGKIKELQDVKFLDNMDLKD